MKFIRYGVIKQWEQFRHDENKPWGPPAKKGFYAFPYGYRDWFFIVNTHPAHPTQKTEWVKINGKKLKAEFTGPYLKVEGLREDILKLLRKKKIRKKDIRFFPLKPEDDPYDDNVSLYIAKFKRPRIFYYSGNLWHHVLVQLKMEKRGVINKDEKN